MSGFTLISRLPDKKAILGVMRESGDGWSEKGKYAVLGVIDEGERVVGVSWKAGVGHG
jgi:hypothetical protein